MLGGVCGVGLPPIRYPGAEPIRDGPLQRHQLPPERRRQRGGYRVFRAVAKEECPDSSVAHHGIEGTAARNNMFDAFHAFSRRMKTGKVSGLVTAFACRSVPPGFA
jgi:hypothetical protein